MQLQPAVSPSPSPSRGDGDDDAFTPPPDTSDDEAAPTSPERQLAKRPAEDSLSDAAEATKQSTCPIWTGGTTIAARACFSRFAQSVRGDCRSRERCLARRFEGREEASECGARGVSKTVDLERLKIIDERLERIHSDRGIDVLLLCGGMGACVVAIYNVGIKINSVTNWEIDPEARWVLENFCKKQGITIETGQPISAHSPSSALGRGTWPSLATSTLR